MRLSQTFSIAFNIISGFTVFFTLSFLFLISFWLFYPYEPITFTHPKTRILNENRQVRQGEILQSEVDIIYAYNIPLTIDRRIVDGVVYYTLPSTIETERGYHKYIQNGLTIPAHLPPGKYHTVLYLHFKVNPLRIITIKRESEEFEVLPKL